MSTTVSSDELLVSRLPIAIWLSLVFAASLILQNFTRPAVIASLIFALVMALHFYIHWMAHRFAQTYPWGYVLIQHMLLGIGALLLPQGYQAILIGFLPVLVAQSLAVFDQKRKIAGVLLVSVALFSALVGVLGQLRDLALLGPLLIMMLVVVIAYALLFFNQVHARVRTQAFLNDLEIAHRKVEELTLANERQRMARDLHDTLAQGVAGLIMQLEAAEAFMMQGNTGRTETIIRQSKEQARRTLADARRAIDNLRTKSAANTDFREAAEAEIERFLQAIGMVVYADIRFVRSPSRMAAEHLLQILSECLTNVAKHAQADKVWVSVSEHGGRLDLEIRDNGSGFNVNQIGKQAGHYGLLGIQERVRLFGGTLHVHSSGDGTRIRVEAPLSEGGTA
ncbi:sensor histidine kinase [Saccharibacillus sp. O23]|uniref:sensor histidine kinase n=1 Tax=Saccharibacillus sp. O23 TaxID=2009338 RepID=UPI0015C5E12F|nr:sensor histidine kinase [Saccharibacillus sp. O23]